MKRFVFAATLAAALVSPAFGAKVPRAVLKEYFQTGDVPTQEDFADLIDSLIHYTDDRDFIGLRTYNPSLTYDTGDTVVFNKSLYSTSSGENVSTNPADYLNFSTHIAAPLNEVHFDMASHFGGQHGFLEFVMGDSSGLYFGYMQITMAPVGPGDTNPSFFVEYLAYEDTPFASMAIVELPEPASLLVLGAGVGALLFRRRR